LCFQGRQFYEGQWMNGRRTGHGRMVYKNGEEYIGGWNNNLQVQLLSLQSMNL
jgi:hypothetical protein